MVVLLHLSLGERSRRRQLEYVAELIDGEDHVVVMGDLNSHVARLLGDSPLTETGLRPAEHDLPTYPAWRPSVALDHVLVSPTLSVQDCRVLDCQLSDHQPVAVSVGFSREAPGQAA